MRYLDKMLSFVSDVKAIVTYWPLCFNDISTPSPRPLHDELNASINFSKLITIVYCNSCYEGFTFSYMNKSNVIRINYVYLNYVYINIIHYSQ